MCRARKETHGNSISVHVRPVLYNRETVTDTQCLPNLTDNNSISVGHFSYIKAGQSNIVRIDPSVKHRDNVE